MEREQVVMCQRSKPDILRIETGGRTWMRVDGDGVPHLTLYGWWRIVVLPIAPLVGIAFVIGLIAFFWG